MLERKDIIISTNSRRVGEINGLAVYSLGDLSFGVPTRITCRTYKGKPGILNIERERHYLVNYTTKVLVF